MSELCNKIVYLLTSNKTYLQQNQRKETFTKTFRYQGAGF